METVRLSLTYLLDKIFYIVNLEEYHLPNIKYSHLKNFCKTNIHKSKITLFQFKLFKYLYNFQTNSFHGIKFDIKTSQENIHSHFLNGLDREEVTHQKLIFGQADLDIRIDSIWTLILKEVTDPFYIFQVFSIILWYFDEYAKYATVIVLTTLISLIVSVWETRSNLLSIQKMARYACDVEVYRKGEENSKEESKKDIKEHFKISSRELVPGDLFELPEDGMTLPCDLILISGTVIVNESMLTGESTPIMKTHMPNTKNQFDASVDKKYILFAGTKIVQKRAFHGGKVLGLVYSTAFNTEKGNLIRSILFPKETEFKFKSDSIKYIFFMAFLSIIGYIITLPLMIENNIEPINIMFRGFDLVTTTVPPSLPACIGIGISYALSRLKKYGISCINRTRMNIAGRINMICFDKTGTLTEDHLDINGFRTMKLTNDEFTFDNFCEEARDMCQSSFNYYKEKVSSGNNDKNKDLKSLYVECLATCHGITRVNGKLMGDPIDVKMFESSGWTLNENLENQENYDSLISTSVRPGYEKDLREKLGSEDCEDEDLILKTHYELGIVRRFDFSSKLQRMSVIVKNTNEPHFKAFCKGSPEKIKELCKAETIPQNFNVILNKYTMKGFRVLALSAKLVKMDYMQSQRVERDIIESNMIFLGLLIVQNRLKEKTCNSINVLHNANLRMVMATGDNILTAISVAKECELVSPDVPVYTCELNKKNNEQTLSWQMVDTFLDKDEDKSILEEHMAEINFSTAMMNSDLELKPGFTQYFRPESIGETSPIILDSYNRTLRDDHNEKEFVKKEIAEDLESDVLYIDVEKYPSVEDEYVIAITGPTFERLWMLRNKYVHNNNDRYKLHYETFRLILQNCYIFARMSPEHKTILVDCLREERFTVCMCGDGANDCGALRAADVGVSLSQEEASIAAPFTSNVADISCLIKLLKEGKASLVSSIQTFKYMMMYSIIQFISVSILVIVNSYLSDNQFLIADLFIIFPMAILIARTGAYHKLTPHQPTGALISVPIITSILLQTLIQFSAQFGIWMLVKNQSWHKSDCYADETVGPCMDNSV
jgi:cation-transporting ATPase 13A2